MYELDMPSELAEQEQLHVEQSSEQLTSLDCVLQLHACRWRKAGWGLEMRLEYERVEPSGLTVLEQLHVELNRECS